VRNKQVTVAVLMFVLVVASIHLGISEVRGQEIADSSSKGTASQSVTPTIYENPTRLAAFGVPREDALKSDAPTGATTAQAAFQSHDGRPASPDNGYGENDKCDCAERFFPQSGIEIPSTK
jgi:hypothetical protein